jgi:hypothetical protein
VKQIVVLVALVTMVVTCGGKVIEPEVTLLGLWKLVATNDEPVTVNYTIDFRVDGSYAFTNTIYDGNKITSQGSWAISGDRLTMEGVEFVFRLREQALTLLPTSGSGSFTYEKQ